MSLLHWNLDRGCDAPVVRDGCGNDDKRFERDPIGDIKHGIDLVMQLKGELEKLHPLARETVIRMMNY